MSQFANSLSSAMTPLYVEKFQLTNVPFSERYKEALYYQDESRNEILKKIAHLTDYTNLVLFIQGADGLGKTSLLKHRLNNEKSNWRICYFSARDYVNPENFIEKLFTDFQLKFNADADISDPRSLHEQIESIRQTGHTPVVIIDDIDHLNPKLIPTLQSLISFQENSQPIVRLIIAGEDIPESLSSILPKENDDVAIKYLPLAPLTEKETSAYIKYRLTQSGYTQVEPFNKKQLKRIYLDSKGFPKYINALADHLMNQFMQTDGDKRRPLPISDDASKKLKITAIVLSICIVITLIVIMTTDSSEEEQIAELDENVKALEIPDIKKEATKTPERIIAKAPIKQSTTPTPIPAKKAEPVTKPEIVEAEKKTPEPEVIKIAEPVAEKPAPDVKPKPAPKKKKLTRIKQNEVWIRKQNPDHYTIQLIGSSTEKGATNFMEKHNIRRDSYYFRTIRKGNEWYSVIYKSYPSGRAARKAAKDLPSSLKKIKPWIRQFKDIQKSIK